MPFKFGCWRGLENCLGWNYSRILRQHWEVKTFFMTSSSGVCLEWGIRFAGTFLHIFGNLCKSFNKGSLRFKVVPFFLSTWDSDDILGISDGMFAEFLTVWEKWVLDQPALGAVFPQFLRANSNKGLWCHWIWIKLWMDWLCWLILESDWSRVL